MDEPRSLDDTRWLIWSTMYYSATGRWPTKDQWPGRSDATASPCGTHQNHVRDAMRANQSEGA